MHGSTLAQYCYYLAPTVHRDLSEERQKRHIFQCVRVVLLCMELCLLYTECQLVMSMHGRNVVSLPVHCDRVSHYEEKQIAV